MAKKITAANLIALYGDMKVEKNVTFCFMDPYPDDLADDFVEKPATAHNVAKYADLPVSEFYFDDGKLIIMIRKDAK